MKHRNLLATCVCIHFFLDDLFPKTLGRPLFGS